MSNVRLRGIVEALGIGAFHFEPGGGAGLILDLDQEIPPALFEQFRLGRTLLPLSPASHPD
jgi:hypothetical protein